MLRRVENAKITIERVGVPGRLLKTRKALVLRIGKKLFLVNTSGDPSLGWDRILDSQQRRPVPLVRADGRQYWTYKDKYYWENEGLSTDEVQALLDDRARRKRRQIERAKAGSPTFTRERALRRDPIPDDVKMYVWRRDEGSCVKCGSQMALEFDHIIPLTMGGSNTARNIQLLCEACNRTKGGNLV